MAPLISTEIGLGKTVFDRSKVFPLSTLGAVRVSPPADLAAKPSGSPRSQLVVGVETGDFKP